MARVSREKEAYKLIAGIMPSAHDFKNWSEEKFLAFFDYCAQFTMKDVRGESRLAVAGDAIMWANDFIANGEDIHYKEFSYRINEISVKNFRIRLQAFMRNVGTFLRRHPAYITTAMQERTRDNRQLSWMVNLYVMERMQNGVEIPISNNRASVGADVVKGVIPNTQLKLVHAQAKLVDILWMMANSITREDIAAMSPEAKLNIIPKLIFSMRDAKQFRINNVFQKINVKAADARTLEQALLNAANRDQSLREDDGRDAT